MFTYSVVHVVYNLGAMLGLSLVSQHDSSSGGG
jgi:hypothetical protein